MLNGMSVYSWELTFADVVLFQGGLSEVGCLGGRKALKMRSRLIPRALNNHIQIFPEQ
jgi:hypothetical protein